MKVDSWEDQNYPEDFPAFDYQGNSLEDSCEGHDVPLTFGGSKFMHEVSHSKIEPWPQSPKWIANLAQKFLDVMLNSTMLQNTIHLEFMTTSPRGYDSP